MLFKQVPYTFAQQNSPSTWLAVMLLYAAAATANFAAADVKSDEVSLGAALAASL
jgi:uncharacterized membrane protein